MIIFINKGFISSTIIKEIKNDSRNPLTNCCHRGGYVFT